MRTTAKVTIGALAGLSFGILAGILIAPNSGKKTIKKLVGKTKDLRDDLVDTVTDAKKVYNKKVEALVDDGRTAINSLKNSLKV